MDHLYTPWRMDYIRGERSGDAECVFCAAPAQDDAGSLILARGKHHYAILNRFPYNIGHLMIVPYAHVASPEALDADSLLELMTMSNRAMAVLRAVYQPPAYNLGANIGPAAGAGIAAHYHFHVVPRWPGDANFMTVVGETRVLPDTLERTHTALSAAWVALDAPAERTEP